MQCPGFFCLQQKYKNGRARNNPRPAVYSFVAEMDDQSSWAIFRYFLYRALTSSISLA